MTKILDKFKNLYFWPIYLIWIKEAFKQKLNLTKGCGKATQLTLTVLSRTLGDFSHFTCIHFLHFFWPKTLKSI